MDYSKFKKNKRYKKNPKLKKGELHCRMRNMIIYCQKSN